MWKSLLYTLITYIFYYLAIFVFGLLLSSNFITNLFININDAYWNFLLNFFTYGTLIIALIILIKIFKIKEQFVNYNKINLKSIIQIIFIVMLFRILQDPILRYDIISGQSIIPTEKTQLNISILELINLIINIVILGPIFEEILFRRIMINYFEKKYVFVAIMLSSILFATIHFNLSYTNFSFVFINFIFGILAALIYINKGLFYSILFHIFNNTLWLVLKIYVSQYWKWLQKIDFSYIYWLIVFISLILLIHQIILIAKSSNKITKIDGGKMSA